MEVQEGNLDAYVQTKASSHRANHPRRHAAIPSHQINLDMTHERYFQYTKGWTQITVRNRNPGSILDWCNRHQSVYGFHVVRSSMDPYLITAIRFESNTDAMQFAIEFSQ